jgi:tRNA(fMet)-specific endonuclease VapC
MKSVRAKLFQNGGSQAVRLPKACRFPGQAEVLVRREGRRVILEPADEWSDEFRACLGSSTAEAAAAQRAARSLRLMLRYMLDTDTVSYALRGHGRVAAVLEQHRPSEISISSLTLAELRFGAENRRSKKLHQAIDAFATGVSVVSFDASAAASFAPIAVALRQRGEPIGSFDTLIAAHALSLGLILVTNNSEHFGRVPGLRTENWA